MTSSTRVPPTEITGVFGAVLKRMSRRMLGQVPDAAGAMWHHPAVFKDLMRFGRRTDSWDRLDPQLATLAAMAAAGTIGCSFCLDLHYFLTHDRGLDEAKAREVPRWRESTVFTPVERDVLEYAEAVSQTPPTVTDELSARLLAALGAPALLELTTVIGLANLYTRTNTAFGIESQGFAASCDLRPLAAPSTT